MELRWLCKLSILFLVVINLSGCPRGAYLRVYNNTNDKLHLFSGYEKVEINQGESSEVKFLSSSFKVKIKDLEWVYSRKIPGNGVNSKYFSGTLVIQVQSDGKAYVLKQGDRLPIRARGYDQPPGYPLTPNSKPSK